MVERNESDREGAAGNDELRTESSTGANDMKQKNDGREVSMKNDGREVSMNNDGYEASMNGGGTLVDRLAEKFGRTSASTVYGDPVEQGGTTVIPVAKVRYGFGGGGGEGENKQEGSGGGGGLVAAPMGYIEMKNGETNFHRIRDPRAIVPLIVAGGFAGAILMRSLVRLMKTQAEISEHEHANNDDRK